MPGYICLCVCVCMFDSMADLVSSVGLLEIQSVFSEFCFLSTGLNFLPGKIVGTTITIAQCRTNGPEGLLDEETFTRKIKLLNQNLNKDIM